jgi:hypothetical protein
MIRAIYYHADTGRAYKILVAPDLNGFPDADPGGLALLMPDSVQLPGYVLGTSYIPIGGAPSDHHAFNWVTKQWEDPRTLADFQDIKWEAIKLARAANETGTFQWNGHTIDADMARLNGAATSVMIAQAAGYTYSDVWTLADNTTIPVTGQDIFAMGLALAAHVSACHSRGRALRQLIYSCTTKEEVEAITWETAV